MGISCKGRAVIMANKAEEKVSNFYNTVGWETEGEITEDGKRWEDLREYAKEYVGKCRLRVLRHIPKTGENLLDMASGPIQYSEYLEYSKNFKKRYCVDLSSSALESAKKKIGDHGVFLHGSFFDIPLEENFFDCTISIHTIYHMDKDKQEEAVRKLVKVTKPEKPVIIVYDNPNTLISSILGVLRGAKNLFKKEDKNTKKEQTPLYFHRHSNEWWGRFSDVAQVQILPWRSFSAKVQKKLIPNNKMGGIIFNFLFNLEDRFPKFFVRYFQHPMIILTKRKI